ncbi:PHD and RING finger domain-containing protein 1-like [Alosa sapidissima]|uniref:PHD and RING finger domain-containing protein 1-like n=1 Tax=Alosa sapidissima TaxID=34773 RepID=UPI001C09BADB|nr:PHD and RING finger domain-containing protein 1-like [Alosa sapidissima]
MAPPDPVRCLICFSNVVGQVAIPENCDHSFCLDCIMEWSRNTNTCPVDRITFNVIYQTDYPGGKVKNTVKVERPLNKKEDVSDDQVICEKCGRSDFGHLLIMCSTCETGYHATCLTPPLGAVPAQDWMCQECTDSHGSFFAEEDGVSAEEIAYLLAEAAPTPGRLRLSTLTSTSASIGTRRSKRLRAQASKGSNHQTHSAQHVPKYLLKLTVPCDKNDPSSSSNIKNLCSPELGHKRKRGGTDVQ